jgi:hypothetical protein
MIIPIPIKSLIITGVIFITNLIFKTKLNLSHYLILFLSIMGLSYFLSSKCEASDQFAPSYYDVYYDCYNFNINAELTAQDRAYYVSKINEHEHNAKAHYEIARNKCWWLPDLSDRNKAKYCFTSVMSTVGANSYMSKLICSLITMLTQYGLDCIDEWNTINTNLLWSQYNYKMKEFYENVLING